MAEDKNLTCRDCAKTFVFTAGEQAFFEEKGLSAPIRCPDCRRLRKQQRSMDAPPGASAGSAPPRTGGGSFRPSGDAPRPAGGAPRTGGGGNFDRSPGFRPADGPPRQSRDGADGDDDRTRGFRKARPPASVTNKFSVPKKEQAPVAKEKRPNNRRDQEKLLLNWKEEVGLDDELTDEDWLAPTDDEGEE